MKEFKFKVGDILRVKGTHEHYFDIGTTVMVERIDESKNLPYMCKDVTKNIVQWVSEQDLENIAPTGYDYNAGFDWMLSPKACKDLLKEVSFWHFSSVKRVIHNETVTVVFFDDGDKVIVRRAEGVEDCVYSAVAYAIAKKLYGSNSAFQTAVDRALGVKNEKGTKN